MNGVLTLTPNPALDQTYQVRLRPGEVHRIDAPQVRAGGKGLNVARVVARAGRPVVAIAPVDAPQLSMFGDQLSADGVTPELVLVNRPLRHSMALVDEEADQTTVLNEFGMPISRAEWSKLDDCLIWSLAKYHPRVVVISGSMPPDAPTDFFDRVVRNARTSNSYCIVDSSGPALLAAVAAGVDLVKPNAVELREATGRGDITQGVAHLLERSPNPDMQILVSRGSSGIGLFGRTQPTVTARPAEHLRGNPTGAGDAVVAAAAVGRCSGWSAERLVRTAVQWSAAAVLSPVAGELGPLPDAAQIVVSTGN